MIAKKGRKPYNPRIPRYVDQELVASTGKFIENKDVPYNYDSVQRRINKGPGRTVDPVELTSYIKKAKFAPITFNEVEIGTRIAYITKENKWRSGGYVVSKNVSLTTYDNEQEMTVRLPDEVLMNSTPNMFLEYKAFNNAIFSLQKEDILQLFAKKKFTEDEKKQRARERKLEYKTRNRKLDYLDPARSRAVDSKIPVLLKEPEIRTNYPIYDKNSLGSSVVIYYAKDKYSMTKFLESQKYMKILENGWEFAQKNEKGPLTVELSNTYKEDSDADAGSDSDYYIEKDPEPISKKEGIVVLLDEEYPLSPIKEKKIEKSAIDHFFSDNDVEIEYSDDDYLII
jgi:hypothetical protein